MVTIMIHEELNISDSRKYLNVLVTNERRPPKSYKRFQIHYARLICMQNKCCYVLPPMKGKCLRAMMMIPLCRPISSCHVKHSRGLKNIVCMITWPMGDQNWIHWLYTVAIVVPVKADAVVVVVHHRDWIRWMLPHVSQTQLRCLLMRLRWWQKRESTIRIRVDSNCC